MYDLIIRGGTLVNQDGIAPADLGIREGRISEIGNLTAAHADEVFDAVGLHVLPGVIDTQVHFREPGLTHKEDLETGSRAAVAGGVTAVFEMPNTSPSTVTAEAIADKVARGRNRMFCDFAFYAGASQENLSELAQLERLPGVAGIKVFMGSSTGSLLVSEESALTELLRVVNRRTAFHSEDETRLNARKDRRIEGDPASHPVWRDELTALESTQRLLRLARAAGKRIHVLHVTTLEEINLLAGYRDIASVEVTPQHLTLAAGDAYARLGTYAQMNPPIRREMHRQALWGGVHNGTVDVIGSDHAPHTREEKDRPYPASPSGMTGVQTLVPIMLDHVNNGRLSLARFVDLTAHGPQRLFGLAGKGRLAKGYDADITIVDMKARRTIRNDWIESRCGWTPFDGQEVQGWPIATIVRGRVVMRDGDLIGPAHGQPVRFQETLQGEPE